MNFGWNIETIVLTLATSVSLIISLMIIKINWRRYGALYLLSAVVSYILCQIFIELDFYSFPYRLFPKLSAMPLTAILTAFPLYVLLGVRYSPRHWAWKIPFYWALVHLGVIAEVWAENQTQIITYGLFWDSWDSYTWWWIYLLIFEWIGSLIIPQRDRKPIHIRHLKFGRIGWFIIHFILITTIFLAGYYTAWITYR